MRIDAHHHFWRYDAAEYGWIDDSMSMLRRDFMPADLKLELETVGIDSVISVQAQQSLPETRRLLELAAQHEFVKGVVGWVPLAKSNVREDLDLFCDRPKLKAIRHVVQDEPDDNFILRDDFNAGVAVLKDYQLAYDILVFERHLPPAIQFVDRHPQQTFIVDHLAKPRVRENIVDPWATNIRKLAERENVYCKLSGLVTEADWRHWSEPQLTPYFDVVLEAFGPRRLMFGSDWPVCLLAASYRSWYELCRRFCLHLSPDEQARIFGGTAIEAYRI